MGRGGVAKADGGGVGTQMGHLGQKTPTTQRAQTHGVLPTTNTNLTGLWIQINYF